jgi:hypothetical protein
MSLRQYRSGIHYHFSKISETFEKSVYICLLNVGIHNGPTMKSLIRAYHCEQSEAKDILTEKCTDPSLLPHLKVSETEINFL